MMFHCLAAKRKALCMPVWAPLAIYLGFPGGSEVKVSACNAGDLGSIPGSGRSSGEGNGNPLQYSCLEKATYLAVYLSVTLLHWHKAGLVISPPPTIQPCVTAGTSRVRWLRDEVLLFHMRGHQVVRHSPVFGFWVQSTLHLVMIPDILDWETSWNAWLCICLKSQSTCHLIAEWTEALSFFTSQFPHL